MTKYHISITTFDSVIMVSPLQLPESLSSSLEQSLSVPSLPRPWTAGLEKDKQKEIRDREKVEKRLTEVKKILTRSSSRAINKDCESDGHFVLRSKRCG